MMELKRALQRGRNHSRRGPQESQGRIGHLGPYEFAVAEQGQQSLDPDECRKEDIQAMIDLFSDVLSTKRPELPADHPLSHYYQENDTLRGILEGDRGSGAVPADQEPVAGSTTAWKSTRSTSAASRISSIRPWSVTALIARPTPCGSWMTSSAMKSIRPVLAPRCRQGR